jgi:hypothetical protein
MGSLVGPWSAIRLLLPLIVHKSRFWALRLLCLALLDSTVPSIPSNLCGDAVLFNKTAAASALIY